MSWGLLLLGGAFLAVSVLTAIAHVADQGTRSDGQAVLPAHYDVRNYYPDASRVPGWCADCETMNDPEYNFCENCASELSGTAGTSSSREFKQLFGQN